MPPQQLRFRYDPYGISPLGRCFFYESKAKLAVSQTKSKVPSDLSSPREISYLDPNMKDGFQLLEMEEGEKSRCKSSGSPSVCTDHPEQNAHDHLEASSATSLSNASESPSPVCTPVPGALAYPPPGTFHKRLWGSVAFIEYPRTPYYPRSDTIYPTYEGDAVRCFIGQLPYSITDIQLAWLLYTFGGRHGVLLPEHIVKRNPRTGRRQLTGCIHAFASREGLAAMANLMHKRVLIDEAGVWYCRDYNEKLLVREYVRSMKNDVSLRPEERPYDTVVVQEASSEHGAHHGMRHPTWVTGTPPASREDFQSTRSYTTSLHCFATNSAAFNGAMSYADIRQNAWSTDSSGRHDAWM